MGLSGVVTGATSSYDGKSNVESVINNGWYNDLPAFVWCGNYGDGWYLPAINELTELFNVRDILNEKLSKAGYATITADNHLSSTESGSTGVYVYGFPKGVDTGNRIYSNFDVRAIISF